MSQTIGGTILLAILVAAACGKPKMSGGDFCGLLLVCAVAACNMFGR